MRWVSLNSGDPPCSSLPISLQGFVHMLHFHILATAVVWAFA
jgi:hypothetical protein